MMPISDSYTQKANSLVFLYSSDYNKHDIDFL